MSPRIVLQNVAKPLLVAGAVWGCTAIGDVLAAPGQTPPPCSPDGHCVPRPETFGWYQTRWRRFPGDRYGIAPTPAAPTGAEAQEEEERDLGGPQEPESAEEGQVGPPRPTRSSGQRGAAPAAPEEGAPGAAPEVAPGAAPGAAPAAAPPAGGPAPAAAPPAAAPGLEPARGAQPLPELGEPSPFGEPPASDEPDPFSAAPPVPPLRSAPQVIAAPAPPAVKAVEHRQPAAIAAPHAHREDGPPALPASLERVSQLMPGQPAVAAAPISLPPIAQPSSVAPLRTAPPRVAQVNYQEPSNVQLVNPAAVMTEQHGQPQLEQAIYYEATDQREEILRY